MQKERLFKAFPPVSTKEWKEKIIRDIKGADYSKQLAWKTEEGFKVQPFYRSEDLEKFPHMNVFPGSFPYVRGNEIKNNNWLVRQDIKVDDIENANKKALKIRLQGVDSLGFYLNDIVKLNFDNIKHLLENIPIELMEINFKSNRPLEIVKNIDSLAKKTNLDTDKITGSVEYDPIGDFSLNGRFYKSEEEDLALLKKLHNSSLRLPKFQYLCINATIFNNSGGGIVSELAFSMAMAVDYLTYLTDTGLDIDDVAPKIRFHFSVGSNYFMEIAKFRAAKYLWAKIVNAYGLKSKSNATIYIHCSNSRWNKTIYDPYVNMLRTTTESMSAILGGVNSLSVSPYNSVFETGTEFSERIARNQQLILKGESYFDKVADVSAGSYYIESLTDKLIHGAWGQFLKVDKEGGYIKAFKKGIIQKIIESEASNKDGDIAMRKRSLIGTNQFPNTDESINSDFELPKRNPTVENDGVQPLVIYRGSEQLEELRLSTDKFANNNKRPVVWMFTFGDLAKSNARAQFAGNFFGCAGYEIVDNTGFNTVEEGIAAAKDYKPEIVVICSSNEEYKDIAEPIYNALVDEAVVVLAGYPKKQLDRLKGIGLTNFVHVNSNLLDELKKYQKLLIS